MSMVLKDMKAVLLVPLVVCALALTGCGGGGGGGSSESTGIKRVDDGVVGDAQLAPGFGATRSSKFVPLK